MKLNSNIPSSTNKRIDPSFVLASLGLLMIIPVCEYFAFRFIDTNPQLIYDAFTPIYYLASILIVVSAFLCRRKVMDSRIRNGLLVLVITYIVNALSLYLRNLTLDISYPELYNLATSSLMLLTPVGLLLSLRISRINNQKSDILQGRKLIFVYTIGILLISILTVFEDYVYGYHTDEEIYLNWTNVLNIKVLSHIIILFISSLSGLYGIYLVHRTYLTRNASSVN